MSEAPCDASADGLTITCTILPAKFTDGSQLTAEDVKFTYDLARSPTCPFGSSIGCPGDPEDPLITAVDVLDPATVRFTLSRLDPTFITRILPGAFIDSKALVESQFESFRAPAAAVGAARLRQEAEGTQSTLEANDEAGCLAKESEVETLAGTAGIELPDEQIFKVGPEGTLDAPRLSAQANVGGLWLAKRRSRDVLPGRRQPRRHRRRRYRDRLRHLAVTVASGRQRFMAARRVAEHSRRSPRPGCHTDRRPAAGHSGASSSTCTPPGRTRSMRSARARSTG